MDIISAVTRQTKRQIENINKLTAELTSAIKNVLDIIPQEDRSAAVDSFLDGIKSALVGTTRVRGKKRGRRKGTKTAQKPERKPGRPRKRGRKPRKQVAAAVEATE